MLQDDSTKTTLPNQQFQNIYQEQNDRIMQLEADAVERHKREIKRLKDKQQVIDQLRERLATSIDAASRAIADARDLTSAKTQLDRELELCRRDLELCRKDLKQAATDSKYHASTMQSHKKYKEIVDARVKDLELELGVFKSLFQQRGEDLWAHSAAIKRLKLNLESAKNDTKKSEQSALFDREAARDAMREVETLRRELAEYKARSIRRKGVAAYRSLMQKCEKLLKFTA